MVTEVFSCTKRLFLLVFERRTFSTNDLNSLTVFRTEKAIQINRPHYLRCIVFAKNYCQTAVFTVVSDFKIFLTKKLFNSGLFLCPKTLSIYIYRYRYRYIDISDSLSKCLRLRLRWITFCIIFCQTGVTFIYYGNTYHFVLFYLCNYSIDFRNVYFGLVNLYENIEDYFSFYYLL